MSENIIYLEICVLISKDKSKLIMNFSLMLPIYKTLYDIVFFYYKYVKNIAKKTKCEVIRIPT